MHIINVRDLGNFRLKPDETLYLGDFSASNLRLLYIEIDKFCKSQRQSEEGVSESRVPQERSGTATSDRDRFVYIQPEDLIPHIPLCNAFTTTTGVTCATNQTGLVYIHDKKTKCTLEIRDNARSLIHTTKSTRDMVIGVVENGKLDELIANVFMVPFFMGPEPFPVQAYAITVATFISKLLYPGASDIVCTSDQVVSFFKDPQADVKRYIAAGTPKTPESQKAVFDEHECEAACSELNKMLGARLAAHNAAKTKMCGVSLPLTAFRPKEDPSVATIKECQSHLYTRWAAGLHDPNRDAQPPLAGKVTSALRRMAGPLFKKLVACLAERGPW